VELNSSRLERLEDEASQQLPSKPPPVEFEAGFGVWMWPVSAPLSFEKNGTLLAPEGNTEHRLSLPPTGSLRGGAAECGAFLCFEVLPGFGDWRVREQCSIFQRRYPVCEATWRVG
jgi:hypothetical protein